MDEACYLGREVHFELDLIAVLCYFHLEVNLGTGERLGSPKMCRKIVRPNVLRGGRIRDQAAKSVADVARFGRADRQPIDGERSDDRCGKCRPGDKLP